MIPDQRRAYLYSLSREERRRVLDREARERLIETGKVIAAMMKARRETDKTLS